MITRLITYLVIAQCILFSSAVTAQQQGQKKQKSKVTFSCILWKSGLKEDIYFKDGEKFEKMKLFTSSRSPIYKLDTSKSFSIFVKDENVAEGESPYKQIGQTALPAGTKRILFILFENQGEELSFKIRAVDDSLNGFPPGSFRFFNFSKSALFVKFDENTKKIEPLDMTMMKTKAAGNGGLIPFVIGNKEKKKVFETRLFAQATGRELVFIMPPKAVNQLPQVRFISQLLGRDEIMKHEAKKLPK